MKRTAYRLEKEYTSFALKKIGDMIGSYTLEGFHRVDFDHFRLFYKNNRTGSTDSRLIHKSEVDAYYLEGNKAKAELNVVETPVEPAKPEIKVNNSHLIDKKEDDITCYDC